MSSAFEGSRWGGDGQEKGQDKGRGGGTDLSADCRGDVQGLSQLPAGGA